MFQARRSRMHLPVTLVILVLMTMIFGCATSRILSLQHKPDCKTSVEGFYYCVDHWYLAKPALIIRHGYGMKILFGEIVSRDDGGVTFKPRKEGSIFDPRPEYFPFKNIEALINKDGDVEYGVIPKQYSKAYALELHLKSLDESNPKTITLVLEPNRQFGFCVPSGNYIVAEMLFRNDYQKIIDEGVDIPSLEIRVVENRSNYIGNIYMNCGNLDRDDLMEIPYKVKRRPSKALDPVIAGAAGGLVAAVLVASSGSSPSLPKGVVGVHLIYVEGDAEAPMLGKSQKMENLIIRKD